MMEAKPGSSPGFSNLAFARVAPGPRAEKYVGLFRRTDPLADAVMDAFARVPESVWRPMLDLAIARGIEPVPHAPDWLRALLAQLGDIPFWVDRDLCDLGGATFLPCGTNDSRPRDAVRFPQVWLGWNFLATRAGSKFLRMPGMESAVSYVSYATLVSRFRKAFEYYRVV